MTLFDLPAPPPEPEPDSESQPAGRCRRCKRLIRDPVSLGYQIGPDCRHRLGIDPPKKPPRFSVRWTGPVKDQLELLASENERKTMAFIDEEDTPELLKAQVNGQDGFVVFPQGEDEDGLYFASVDALRSWSAELQELVSRAQDAQRYEEWLMYGSSRDDDEDEGEGR